MSNWFTIGYSSGLRSIESAYAASKRVLEEERDRTLEELRGYSWRNPDEGQWSDDDALERQYMDHVVDLAYEADTGLKLINEAFALTAYHFWEKEMSRLLGISGRGVNHKAIVAALKKDGRIKADFDALDLLRRISITIKHGNGYELYAAAPQLFSEQAKELGQDDESGWHSFLQLRDDDVREAIKAVWSSAPGPGWGSSE